MSQCLFLCDLEALGIEISEILPENPKMISAPPIYYLKTGVQTHPMYIPSLKRIWLEVTNIHVIVDRRCFSAKQLVFLWLCYTVRAERTLSNLGQCQMLTHHIMTAQMTHTTFRTLCTLLFHFQSITFTNLFKTSGHYCATMCLSQGHGRRKIR